MTIQIIRMLPLIILTLNLFLGQSCRKESNHQPSNKDTTIQVGSRTVHTTKFISDGTPVVPMWEAQMPTSQIHQGAGFPILEEAQHAFVWQPSNSEQGTYNNYAGLIYYKNYFFAMWTNSKEGENAPGQRVFFSYSQTWGEWSEPQELFPSPGPFKPRSEEGIRLICDRWVVIDDVLYGIAYVFGAGTVYSIARSVNEEGVLGQPFLAKDLPNGSSLPVYMQGLNRPPSAPSYSQIKHWYTTHHEISWWGRHGEGIPNRAIDGCQLTENFTYQASDGGFVLLSRCWGETGYGSQNNRMYVSFSDNMSNWRSPSYPTDIPDAPSRAQAITLEDGTVLLIGNQNAWAFDQKLYLHRDPLTVSISKDGYTFDRVYALRTREPQGYRFPNTGGRNPGFAYSSSVVHEGWLYVLYSIGKEDMAITRVPLSAMGLP